MRPRVFPAEDAVRRFLPGQRLGSFNEAAGIPRGRLYRALAANGPGTSLQ